MKTHDVKLKSGGQIVRDLMAFMHRLKLWDETLSFNDAYEVPFEYMDRIHTSIPVKSYQPSE